MFVLCTTSRSLHSLPYNIARGNAIRIPCLSITITMSHVIGTGRVWMWRAVTSSLGSVTSCHCRHRQGTRRHQRHWRHQIPIRLLTGSVCSWDSFHPNVKQWKSHLISLFAVKLSVNCFNKTENISLTAFFLPVSADAILRVCFETKFWPENMFHVSI